MRAFVVLGLAFFHTKPTDRLGETSPKWPILCRVRRKATTQSILFRLRCSYSGFLAFFLNFRKLKKHCEFDDWSRAVGRSTSSLSVGHSVWSVTGQSVHSVHWVAVICDNVVNWPLGSALECRTFAPGASAAGGKCICWPGPILRNFSGCTVSKVRVWCNALTLSKVRAS